MSFTYLNLQGTLEHITVTPEEIDRQMQDMYQRIKASDAYNED